MQKFDVNKLKVAHPCPMNWENMTGDDRVRFCGLCELNVYNFSEMTAAEVNSLIENSGERVCGRLFKKANGTVLTRDCPVGLRGYRRRAAKYAGAVLASMLGLFSIAFAQREVKKENASQIKILRTPANDGQSYIGGMIVDPNGATIPGVKVTLIDRKKKKVSVESNDNGEYRFASVPAGIFTIEFKLKGFKTDRFENVTFDKNEILKLDVGMLVQGTIEGCLLTARPSLIDYQSKGLTTIYRPEE